MMENKMECLLWSPAFQSSLNLKRAYTMTQQVHSSVFRETFTLLHKWVAAKMSITALFLSEKWKTTWIPIN